MRNEIAFRNKENALKVAEEEDLYVVNYEYSQYSDRNDVIFMDREEFESKYYELVEEEK